MQASVLSDKSGGGGGDGEEEGKGISRRGEGEVFAELWRGGAGQGGVGRGKAEAGVRRRVGRPSSAQVRGRGRGQ